MKLLVILVALASGALAGVIIPNTPGEITPLYRYLGVVDGKAFFADSTELRNWENAGKFCDEQGFRLAEINNDLQYQGLKSFYNETFFDGVYWTAGRDSHTMSQIVYNHTNTDLPEELAFPFYVQPELKFQTCLAFHNLISHGLLSLQLCSTEMQTLCEAII